ncbi:PAS domain S-box-containing protein [Mucilaginibacter pineti]|uniref:histidine kinase n=1 Tax=Mucilaginibacter pineti TaxID=1391627 RepID=A0A1G6TD91_9SPHI|nr:PAS domain-containing protein [Mucilaginibacter pineti]SDD27033.1 PAS domain S-box-containing protein [Mucilaginibacter pineti]
MYYPQKSKFIRVTGLLAILAGIFIALGWIFNINSLQTLFIQYVAIRFNTALCFAFLGTALIITQQPVKPYSRMAFLMLSAAVTCIGIFGVLQYLYHFNSIFDRIFDHTGNTSAYTFKSYTAINTTACTVLFGAAFLLFSTKSKSLHNIGQFLLHLVTIVSGVALIGYLYGLSLFYDLKYVSSMPVHTAIIFLGLSIAATLLHPSLGVAHIFTGNKVGNLMARRLFLPLEFIFIVLGFLRFKMQYTHLLPLQLSMYLLSLILLLVCLVVIAVSAMWLNQVDEHRTNAENEVIALNNTLEKRVEERSQALMQAIEKLEKSESKYRSLIEHASDAIYVLDLDSNFSEVNARMCQMTGYTREELLQMRVEAIIDPKHLKENPIVIGLNHLYTAVIKERRFVKKNGIVFDVEINVKRFSEDRVLVIARDITARKIMEAELKDAELKFRTLADKSMVGVYIVQKGRFNYVNPRFAEVFGYTQQELIDAESVDIVISTDYKKMAMDNVRARLSGEIDSIHYEARGQCSDGSLNWVEFYGSRVTIDGEPTIIGSMIDITERKKAEEQLRLSEQKYKLLFDSNPLPMWMIDKNDLTIIAVNAAAVLKYGYSQEEFLTMKAEDLLISYKGENLKAKYTGEIAPTTNTSISNHYKKDGSLIYVQTIAQDIIFEGKPVCLSLGNDVTEKIQSEKLLQKSEAHLQTILNTTDTVYALFDSDLNVLAFNQTAEKFVREQFHQEPEKGDNLSKYLSQERFPHFLKFARHVLTGNNVNYEIDYLQPNGATFWYYVRMFPIIDSDKQILGLMMALYDITERKSTENNLKIAYERIHEQIDSIKNMAWKQSHFIRSPLANLKGLADMLKDDPADVEALNFMLTELNRLDTVIMEMAQDAAHHED